MSTQPIELLEQRLTHFKADPELTQLLTERELAKMGMYVAELSAVQAEMPARIESTASLRDVNNVLSRASVAFKGLEEVRRAHLVPLETETENTNNLFRPLTANLKALIDTGKRLVIRWEAQERERVRLEREALQRKADEAARAQAAAEERAAAAKSEPAKQRALTAFQAEGAKVEQALADMPRDAPRGVRTDEGSSSVRQVWNFEIVDAAQIPREYLMPDEKKLRAAVRSMGVRAIPGVHIYEEANVSVRPARS